MQRGDLAKPIILAALLSLLCHSYLMKAHLHVQGLIREGTQHTNSQLDDDDFNKEAAVEGRCSEAFAAVQHFEKTHCLALQV